MRLQTSLSPVEQTVGMYALAPGTPGANAVLLQADLVRKHYGGVRALEDASISVRAGQIHGLIGENGSGKSTLLGILSGQIIADSANISVRGHPVPHGDAKFLQKNVAIVTQELSLAPDLSVAENILMYHAKPRTWRGLNWPALFRSGEEALSRLGLDLDPRTPVGKLRIDQQQLVEIAKAVQLNHPVLILDEPTSSLTEDAVEMLVRTMRRLRDSGTAIIFVSHRLDEFMAFTDHVTVLRDGQTISSRPTSTYTRETLVEDMLGYPVEHYSHERVAAVRSGSPLLSVGNVNAGDIVKDVSFNVYPSEVLGLFGLEGAGRSELLKAIFGSLSGASGVFAIGDETSSLPQTPLAAMKRGLGLIPGDRKTEGLFLELSIQDNMNIARTAGFWRMRTINRINESSIARDASESLVVQEGSLSRRVGSLSGGNQQKVLIGKWLKTNPKVMLMDEPTRGVDVGAKREIHVIINKVRDMGLGVVVSSSDVEELLTLCDRFLVMFRGRVVGELSHEEATTARLSHMATGGGK